MSGSWRMAGFWHGRLIPLRHPATAGRAASGAPAPGPVAPAPVARSPAASRLAVPAPAVSPLQAPLRAWFTAWWQRAVRGRILPAGLRAQLALDRGERILAAGLDPRGRHALIATTGALHRRAGTDGWSRLGWELITEVSWDPAAGRLTIYDLGGVAPGRTAVRLRDRGAIPELAEERISYTRLGSWALSLDGRRVLAEARRRPATGELLWIVSSPGGLNLGDADVRQQVNEAVTQLREELGISRPPGVPPRLTPVPPRQ